MSLSGCLKDREHSKRERAYKMQKTKCATLTEQLEAESATRWKVSGDREGKDRKHKDWWSGRKMVDDGSEEKQRTMPNNGVR